MGPIVSMRDSTLVYLNVGGLWYYYDSAKPPLGEGAIGIVYLGFRCDTQDRVAIKRVNNIYVDNPIVRQLVRYEASMVFDHPNVVKMIGLCEYSNGRGDMFLICEYVPGITFKDRATQLSVVSHKDATRQVIEDIRAMLPGLAYLHENGFIHRDLKPSNIMIDSASNVKLMDLGTVISMSQMQKAPQLEFVGTPSYASPEQVECKPCDVRSDIYSLGVVLYELLTGENPFSGSTREDSFHKHIYMPLPSHAALPSKLYSIIEKATSKNAEERYTSIGEFDMALADYLAQEGNNSSKVFKTIFPVVILIIIGTLLWLLLFFAL